MAEYVPPPFLSPPVGGQLSPINVSYEAVAIGQGDDDATIQLLASAILHSHEAQIDAWVSDIRQQSSLSQIAQVRESLVFNDMQAFYTRNQTVEELHIVAYPQPGSATPSSIVGGEFIVEQAFNGFPIPGYQIQGYASKYPLWLVGSNFATTCYDPLYVPASAANANSADPFLLSQYIAVKTKNETYYSGHGNTQAIGATIFTGDNQFTGGDPYNSWDDFIPISGQPVSDFTRAMSNKKMGGSGIGGLPLSGLQYFEVQINILPNEQPVGQSDQLSGAFDPSYYYDGTYKESSVYHQTGSEFDWYWPLTSQFYNPVIGVVPDYFVSAGWYQNTVVYGSVIGLDTDPLTARSIGVVPVTGVSSGTWHVETFFLATLELKYQDPLTYQYHDQKFPASQLQNPYTKAHYEETGGTTPINTAFPYVTSDDELLIGYIVTGSYDDDLVPYSALENIYAQSANKILAQNGTYTYVNTGGAIPPSDSFPDPSVHVSPYVEVVAYATLNQGFLYWPNYTTSLVGFDGHGDEILMETVNNRYIGTLTVVDDKPSGFHSYNGQYWYGDLFYTDDLLDDTYNTNANAAPIAAGDGTIVYGPAINIQGINSTDDHCWVFKGRADCLSQGKTPVQDVPLPIDPSNISKSGVWTGVDLGPFNVDDTIMVAVDTFSRKIWFGKNGDWYDMNGKSQYDPSDDKLSPATFLDGEDDKITKYYPACSFKLGHTKMTMKFGALQLYQPPPGFASYGGLS